MSNDTPKIAIRTKAEPLNTRYTVMFDRDIEESNSFHEEFYVMEQATDQDIVDVCISSFGGSVATISKFQDVVKNSSAHFHGKLHGYGYSAGGALFLLCHTQEVSDLASFMAHSIQTGYGGGTQAIEAHSKMSSKQNEALCRMLYEDFLSEEEILRVMDGAEIWMEAEEIRERLKKRQDIRDNKVTEEMKETYTEEFYSQQCAMDIAEDCEGFGYDPEVIVENMLSMIRGEYEPDFESQGIIPIGTEEMNIKGLRILADQLGLTYPKNISEVKLRKLVDEEQDQLEEEYLNDE